MASDKRRGKAGEGEEVGIELNNSNFNLGDLASNLGLSLPLPPPALVAPSDR